MAGYDLKSGELKAKFAEEDQYWKLFNYLFSDSSKKRNTYKFGWLKAILDNLFNCEYIEELSVYSISYERLFAKFAENYWNLITKYHLKQMRQSSVKDVSKIERIFNTALEDYPGIEQLEFTSIVEQQRIKIVKDVSKECKKYVIGALYEDFDGMFYSFDLKGEGIDISEGIYNFMLKYHYDIEQLNYYSWAKFLESINDDDVLLRVIDKLELATPKRSDLSIYRAILLTEFMQDRCFYCGKKLTNKIHVDHFIPWSFVKDDNMWNFVLACPTCNTKKSNKIPDEQLLNRLIARNESYQNIDNQFVKKEFKNYSAKNLRQLWYYSHLTGMKEL